MFSDTTLRHLLTSPSPQEVADLADEARGIAQRYFGTGVFVRGLIEVSNHCKNDCYYCGIRAHNTHATRYRLTMEEILQSCEEGYKKGFRTFVLQGGEDPVFTDDVLVRLLKEIRSGFPEAAITLSLGERTPESYRKLRAAGADRYLLRHETRNEAHYRSLHPANMSAEYRRSCLQTLKELGYQTGTGMMVGTPYQTADHLIEDIRYMQALQPEMIGIGPFVCASNTPFAAEHCTICADSEAWTGSISGNTETVLSSMEGTSYKAAESGVLEEEKVVIPSVKKRVETTIVLVSTLRILFPKANIPATTSLGTLDPTGRERAILAGANVVMPNLTPLRVRKQYALYDNKRCLGTESASAIKELDALFHTIGYHVEPGRGDFIG